MLATSQDPSYVPPENPVIPPRASKTVLAAVSSQPTFSHLKSDRESEEEEEEVVIPSSPDRDYESTGFSLFQSLKRVEQSLDPEEWDPKRVKLL